MIVIKVGGNALSKAQDLSWISTIRSKINAGEQFILVHGGGPQIDRELELHGIERKFVDGFRFTDERTYEVVETVLAGAVQQSLVRLLKSQGIDGVGITGNDGTLLTAKKMRSLHGEDLGQVGEVAHVDPSLLSILLSHDYVPVVTPVSSDKNGVGFNINADLAAAAIAGALNADAAIFMTDVRGIYRNFPDETSLIDEITIEELSHLGSTFVGGMIPKVEAVKEAIESGAQRAHVIDGRDGRALAELLSGSKVGTTVRRG